MKAVVIDIKMPKDCASCPIGRCCTEADFIHEERSKSCILKEVEVYDATLSDIQEIIDYLNMATGSAYRATTPKNQQMIRARMREGFTVDDFKTVIDKKVKSWGKDPKMQEFLRPVTLFGTKFESYLNEKSTTRLGENSFQRMQRLAREGAFDDD